MFSTARAAAVSSTLSVATNCTAIPLPIRCRIAARVSLFFSLSVSRYSLRRLYTQTDLERRVRLECTVGSQLMRTAPSSDSPGHKIRPIVNILDRDFAQGRLPCRLRPRGGRRLLIAFPGTHAIRHRRCLYTSLLSPLIAYRRRGLPGRLATAADPAVPASRPAGRKASMRSRAISKPIRGSGASVKVASARHGNLVIQLHPFRRDVTRQANASDSSSSSSSTASAPATWITAIRCKAVAISSSTIS